VYTFGRFMSELKQVFDHPVCAQDTSKRLLNLRHHQRSIADYSVEFRIVATGSGWGDKSLRGVFLHGFSEQLKDELAVHYVADSLDMVINLAIKLDYRIRERNGPSHSFGSVHDTPPFVRPPSGFSNAHDPNPSSDCMSPTSLRRDV